MIFSKFLTRQQKPSEVKKRGSSYELLPPSVGKGKKAKVSFGVGGFPPIIIKERAGGSRLCRVGANRRGSDPMRQLLYTPRVEPAPATSPLSQANLLPLLFTIAYPRIPTVMFSRKLKEIYIQALHGNPLRFVCCYRPRPPVMVS